MQTLSIAYSNCKRKGEEKHTQIDPQNPERDVSD